MSASNMEPLIFHALYLPSSRRRGRGGYKAIALFQTHNLPSSKEEVQTALLNSDLRERLDRKHDGDRHARVGNALQIEAAVQHSRALGHAV